MWAQSMWADPPLFVKLIGCMVTMQFPHRKEKRSREGTVCGSVMFYAFFRIAEFVEKMFEIINVDREEATYSLQGVVGTSSGQR